MNADAIRLHTSGVLRARADYHERTKCACGRFKPVRVSSSPARCDTCRQPKTNRRRRAA